MPKTSATELLDPKKDIVFKMQFAKHKDCLIDLVNAVRNTEPPVIDLHVINPEITPEEVKRKLVRLDILAQDSTGQVFNLEMQTNRHTGFAARSVFYMARLLSGQLKESESYRRVRPVVGIHLLDFELFADEPDQALWTFEMRARQRHGVMLDGSMELNMIELGKADRLKSHLGHLSPALAYWVTYFKHWYEERVMQQIQHPPIQKAYQNLRALSADKQAWYQQLAREMAQHDEATEKEEMEAKVRIDILRRQLHTKFSELPSSAEQRLQNATLEQLEHWVVRVLTAETLDQVFNDH